MKRKPEQQVVFDWGSDGEANSLGISAQDVDVAHIRMVDIRSPSSDISCSGDSNHPVVPPTPLLEPFPQAPEPAVGAFYRCFCGEMHPKTFSASEHATEAAWLRTKANEWIGHAQYFKEKGRPETDWVIQDCLGMLKVTKAYAAYHEAQARLAGA